MKCQNCIAECKTCKDAPNKCETCIDNAEKFETTCKCKSGFYLKDGQCVCNKL